MEKNMEHAKEAVSYRAVPCLSNYAMGYLK